MIKIAVGIDPGKTGFIAIQNLSTNNHYFYEIPKIGNEIDLVALNKVFEEEVYPFVVPQGKAVKIHAVIEDVHSIFGSSSKSNFSFGRTVGILHALLVANNIPYTAVKPKEWQKEMWQGVPVQKKAGGKKNDTKATSELAARRLFPEIDFRRNERCRVSDDNKIDALLLCEYCKRNFL